MNTADRDGDVCVIGAGLAGLIAAEEFMNDGLRVDVFEAQACVGGRIKDQVCAGNIPVELGANWFSDQQPLIAAQIQRFGLETLATHNDGEHLFCWDDQRVAFRGAIPSIGLLKNADIIQGMARFEFAMARVKANEPWHESLQEYDRESFGQWIDATLFTSTGKEFFRMLSEMVFGAVSYQVSFLYVLYYASRSVSLSSLISVEGGHQGFRFKNGPAQLCQKIAERIGSESIHLNAPVRAVSITPDHVVVETAEVRGHYRAVVCAMSPHAARQILFSPPRLAARERLLQALPMGRVIKVQAIYDKPYWVEKGLSGQVMSNHYPLSYTIDNSPADGACGILAAFVCTGNADRFMAPGVDRRKLVLESIEKMMGIELPEPLEVLIEDWASNQWIGGSYGAYFPPGVMSSMGRLLSEQEPPIYWCGAEYGRAHPCQMEGALESGLRSSREVRAALAMA